MTTSEAEAWELRWPVIPADSLTEEQWAANIPVTLEGLTEKWRRRGCNPSWWQRLWLGPVCTPEYWARIQYDQIRAETIADRKQHYSPTLGPWWLTKPELQKLQGSTVRYGGTRGT